MPKWYMAEKQIDYNLINLDMLDMKINCFQAWWMTAIMEFRYSKAVPSFSTLPNITAGKVQVEKTKH